MAESPVHKRMRHARLARRSDLDVVIDGLEHISLQIDILRKQQPLMIDCLEYIGERIDRIVGDSR